MGGKLACAAWTGRRRRGREGPKRDRRASLHPCLPTHLSEKRRSLPPCSPENVLLSATNLPQREGERKMRASHTGTKACQLSCHEEETGMSPHPGKTQTQPWKVVASSRCSACSAVRVQKCKAVRGGGTYKGACMFAMSLSRACRRRRRNFSCLPNVVSRQEKSVWGRPSKTPAQ